MGIKIKHGRPETMLTAAALAGQARKQEELQKMQMEFDYRQSLRQQDMAIDLQMQERAKQWEIDKMQLRSQIDFQRKEQLRQRKMDSIDSAIQQIDKEVLAGRITEQEAYPIKQKLELSKTGVSVPVSAFPGDEEDRYGIPPWWTSPEWEDTPEGIAAREKALAPRVERPTFTPYNIQQGLGELTTGAPSSALGLPMEVLIEKADHIAYATNRWGPNWHEEVPEAARIIENKFPDEAPHFVTLNQPLTLEIVDSYLIAAGGDITVAQQMAQRDGYDIDIEPVYEPVPEPVIEPLRPPQGQPGLLERKPTVGRIDWDYIMSKGFKRR